jgi:hypothetical protein
MKTLRIAEILSRLRIHLEQDGGTLNSCEVDDLYRAWFRIPDEEETCLEDVEKWALRMMNETPA